MPARLGVGSKTLGNAAVLTISTATASLLVGASQALLASIVPVGEFGAFAFGISFLTLSALLFEFGLFLPVARVVAREPDPVRKREIVGAAVAMFVPVGLCYTAAVVLASLVVDEIFKVDAGSALLLAASFAWTYPFAGIALLLSQGTERFHRYAVTATLGPMLFVAFLAVMVALQASMAVGVALAARGACYAVALLLLVRWLRPKLARVREHMRQFRDHSRRYGFQLYVGNVLALGTYQMDLLMLAALADPRTVALYAVATSMSNAIILPAAGMSAALFPRMARTGELRGGWLVFPWAVGTIGVIGAWLLAEPFIVAVFPDSYRAASQFIIPLAIAVGLRGVAALYNSFLFASGEGRALRNAALMLMVSNVAFNFLLIPPYQGLGAAWACVLAMLVNLIVHILYYRRSRSGTGQNNEGSALPPPAAGFQTIA